MESFIRLFIAVILLMIVIFNAVLGEDIKNELRSFLSDLNLIVFPVLLIVNLFLLIKLLVQSKFIIKIIQDILYVIISLLTIIAYIILMIRSFFI